MNISPKSSAVFIDCDGTLVREVQDPIFGSDLEILRGADRAVKALARASYRCVLVIDGTETRYEGRGPTVLGRSPSELGAMFEARGMRFDRICGPLTSTPDGNAVRAAEIPDGSAASMSMASVIGQVLADMRISPRSSWLIGDETSNIAAAREAGLRSILVETGKAGLDRKSWVAPEFSAPDLSEAVDFVLKRFPRLCECCAGIAASLRKGSLVAVGGASRSGKTTFANALRLVLDESGYRAWVISIDSWLLNKHARTPTVLGRYDIQILRNLAASLVSRSSPLDVSLHAYDKIEQRRVENVRHIRIHPEDIVILEGTIALNLLPESGPGVHKFFVNILEAERKHRVVREYLLRGKTESEALEIYAARQLDELPIIMDSSAHAINIDGKTCVRS